MEKMSKTALFLFDRENTRIGRIVISEVRDTLYLGKITFIDYPKHLKKLFNLHENLANSQVLSLLDKVENKIEKWELRVNDCRVFDVQIMNETDISFITKTPLHYPRLQQG